MLKPQRNASRDYVSLDGFWSFRPDPAGAGEAAGWTAGFPGGEDLAVPGSWNEQRGDLMHYFGPAWYQTRFPARREWRGRGVRLRVGCAQRRARVWLNGQIAGQGDGCYLPFDCNLAPLLRAEAENLLVIEVDGSLDPWDFPPARLKEGEERVGFHNSNPAVTYDFFPHAGLLRSVGLEIAGDPGRIEGIRVRTELAADGAEAWVHAEVECSAPHARREITLEVDGAGEVRSLAADGRARLSLRLSRPRLWDLRRPELYRARVSLREEGRLVDQYDQSFGVRQVEVRGDQFLLNGRPIFLTGFGKHEDFAVVGRGLCLPVLTRDFDLLQWVGANSFRTSHYPYAEEWYELADRLGFLIVGEAPFVGLNNRMYRGEIRARALRVLGRMIARDANHPSVVLWSLANEPDIDGPEGEEFFRALAAEARRLDPGRPITYVAHREPENNRPLDCCDIVSINKYYGWYEQPGSIAESVPALGACLDRFRAAFQKPVLLAEFGADAVAGLHAQPPEMFSEEFQAELIRAQYLEARRRPWVIGTHVWSFADFKTGQSITRVGQNRKGVFTRERQPKLAAHELRRLWAGPESSP